MNRKDFKTVYRQLYDLLIVSIIFFLFLACRESKNSDEWDVYGGGKDRLQYSILNEINTENVNTLETAWVYNTKDADSRGQIQTNPLIVEGVLYGVSPKLSLFALEAATGKEKWVFDPSDS